MPRENTPARDWKATGGTKTPNPSELRTEYSEKIGEVATELWWFWERNKKFPDSTFGSRLDHRIVNARKKTQALIDGFVVDLREWFPSDFDREAEKAMPEFVGKCQNYIRAETVRRWLRLAVSRARQQINQKLEVPTEAYARTATKETVAKSRKPVLTVDQLIAVLKPATLRVGEVAKALGYSEKTIRRMVKRKGLKQTEKGRIQKDKKFRKALASVYSKDVVNQVWPR